MSQDKILRSQVIRGRQVDLWNSGGKLLLRDASLDSVEVNNLEATRFMNGSEQQLDRQMQYCGLVLDEQSQRSDLRQQADYIKSQFPQDQLVVMLDTTTVANSLSCLEMGRVTPLTLLDLSVFTFAALCFDCIVVQPHPMQQRLNAKHLDWFRVITYPDQFIPETLWHFCAGVTNALSFEGLERKRHLESAWCNFLDISPCDISLDFDAWDKYQDSPLVWNGVLASYYADFLPDVGSAAKLSSRNEFLSIQTIRVLFNDELAGYLGLPYVTSSLRSCVHAGLIQRKMQTRLLLDRLLSHFGPPIAGQDDDSPYTSDVSAPFLLGLILERMRQPADYWNILEEYRARFGPLRAKIWQDREKWDGRSGSYLKSFLKYFSDEFKEEQGKVGEVIEASLTVGATLASATAADMGAVGLGIKLMKMLIPSDLVMRTILKQFKPEVYLLFSLSDEARQLRNIEHRISAVWGQTWGRKEHDQLEWLARSQPIKALKLRSLE